MTSYFAYQAQAAIDDLRAEMDSKATDLAESERSRASSGLISTLADIQASTIALILDPDVRSAAENLNDLTEHESILELAFAADRWRELPTLQTLTGLLKKARTDAAVAEQIADLKRGLETARYRRVIRLQSQLEDCEKQLRRLNRARSRHLFVGLVFQVLGLVCLLLKEVPSRASKRRIFD